MKNIFFSLFCLANYFSFCQSSCSQAAPFSTMPFPIVVPAYTNFSPPETGPYYGCTTNLINPTWVSFTTCQAGTFDINVMNYSDIFSFILWGPFKTLRCDSLDSVHVVTCQNSASSFNASFSFSSATPGDNYLLCLFGGPGTVNYYINQSNAGQSGAGLAESCNNSCAQYYDADNVCFVSTDFNTNRHKIYYPSAPASFITDILLLSSNLYNGIYDTVATWNNLASGTVIDTSFPADQQMRYYKLRTKDSCNYGMTSIHVLSAPYLTTQVSGADNVLNYSIGSYLGFQKFYILRGTAPNNLAVIDSINFTSSYTDVNPGSANFYYAVGEKIDTTFCGVNFKDSIAYSNVSCPAFAGIKNERFQNEMNVFPNPANEILNISFEFKKETEIQITDLVGKIVFGTKIENSTGKTIQQINISALSKGIYFVNLISEGKTFCKKFIKQE